MKQKTLGTLVFLLFFSLLQAQKSKNPFDLMPRLDPSELIRDTADTEEIIPGNPFDIVSTPVPERTKRQIKKKKKAETKENQYRQFIFAVVMVLLVILTLLMTLFRSLFRRVYRAFINDNMLNQLYREQEASGNLAFLILYANFLLNLGFFVFLLTKEFGVSTTVGHFWWLLYCIIGVSGLVVLKHLILQLLGAIFPIQKEISVYNFTIIIFGIVIGLILVPVNVFMAYGPENLIPAIIYSTFVVVILIYLFRSLRGLFIANKFLVFHKFHFLLYICTVEIGPILILTKLILGKVGS